MHGKTNPVSTFSGSFQESTFQMDGFVVEKLPGCGIAAVAAGQAVVVINKGTDGVHFEELFLGQKIHCLVDKRSRRVVHARQQTATMDMPDSLAPSHVPVSHCAGHTRLALSTEARSRSRNG